jgi:hypothetical protein
MFAFWVLDAEMATGWEIGIEKKSKKYPIGCRIIEKSFSTQKICIHLSLVN